MTTNPNATFVTFLPGRIEQIEAPFATQAAMPGPTEETPAEEPTPPRKAS